MPSNFQIILIFLACSLPALWLIYRAGNYLPILPGEKRAERDFNERFLSKIRYFEGEKLVWERRFLTYHTNGRFEVSDRGILLPLKMMLSASFANASIRSTLYYMRDRPSAKLELMLSQRAQNNHPSGEQYIFLFHDQMSKQPYLTLFFQEISSDNTFVLSHIITEKTKDKTDEV